MLSFQFIFTDNNYSTIHYNVPASTVLKYYREINVLVSACSISERLHVSSRVLSVILLKFYVYLCLKM